MQIFKLGYLGRKGKHAFLVTGNKLNMESIDEYFTNATAFCSFKMIIPESIPNGVVA